MIEQIRSTIFGIIETAVAPVVACSYVNDGQDYPYVKLGKMELNGNDTDTETGFDGSLIVHVYSKYKGTQEAADLQFQIYQALNGTKPDPGSPWCISGIHQELTRIDYDVATQIAQGYQRFRIFFEPEPEE